MVNIFCYGWVSETLKGGYGVVAVEAETNKILDMMTEGKTKIKTTAEEQELKALLYALDFAATPLQRKEKHYIFFETPYPIILFNKQLPILYERDWKENGKDILYKKLIQPLYYYYTKDFLNCQVRKKNREINLLPQKLARALAMNMKKETKEILKELKKIEIKKGSHRVRR